MLDACPSMPEVKRLPGMNEMSPAEYHAEMPSDNINGWFLWLVTIVKWVPYGSCAYRLANDLCIVEGMPCPHCLFGGSNGDWLKAL